MPSRPIPFDDNDPADGSHNTGVHDTGPDAGHESSGRAQRSGTDDRSHSGPAERHGETQEPNYWFRRAVLIGGVVAVIAAGAFLVVNLREPSSGADSNGSIGADWNRLALTDERSGRIIVENASGEEVGRTDTGVRPITSSSVVGPTGLVVGSPGAAIVDLSNETAETIEIDAAPIVAPAGSALTMIAPSTDGSRGVLVHGPTGDRLDTAEFAPIVGTRFDFEQSRSTPSGRSVLVTDSGNFQSVLLSFDRDQPSYFLGRALAIDDDIVVTLQNVGAEATILVFDHDGETITSGRTSSVRAGMVVDDAVQVVTAEGEILTMSATSGDTETVDQLDIGTIESGVVAASGEVLIVVGASGTALVGPDGQTIASFEDSRPFDEAWSTRSATCVVLTDSTTDTVVAAELATGAIRAEATTTTPITASADGCTLGVPTWNGEVQVISGDDAVSIDTEGELVALAPDASSIAVDIDGRLVLIEVDDPSDETDLGPSSRSIAFSEI